ncbi:MAG: diguanylate cyclase [Wenzhouxiangella sp.]|nr:diguanylate cyclase [Wenzhouxiangella sp.]
MLLCVMLMGQAPQRGLALDPQLSIDQYTLQAWSLDHGLPQSTVNAMVQSPLGYVYIATFGGLARFDGARMELIPEEPACGRRYTSLAVDGQGVVWVGAERGGICRLIDGWLRQPAADGAGIDRVNTIHAGLDGQLWVGTQNGLLELSDDELRSIKLGRLPDPSVLALAQHPEDGVLWVGTAQGLCLYADATCRQPSWARTLDDDFVRVIHHGRDGTSWIGTEFGLYRYSAGELGQIDLPDGLGWIYSVIDDVHGNVWLATSTAGLTRVSPRPQQPAEGSPLRAGGAVSLLSDREGNLWVGLTGRGIKKLAQGRAYGLRLSRFSSVQPFLPVTVDQSGDVWAGLPCRGVVHFGQQGTRLFDGNDGLTNTCIWSLLPMSGGELMVGTHGGGLFRLDELGTAHLVPELDTREGIVRALYQRSNGEVLVGTDQGVFRYLPAVSKVERVAGTEDEDVFFLTEDQVGGVWIGTRAGALRIQGAERRRFDETNGLSGRQVRVIYPDADGLVWIGTYGGGLNRVDGEQVFVFDRSNGMPDDIVSSLFEDQAGRFWMSANRGVMRVGRATLNAFAEGQLDAIEMMLLDRNDGMPASETNGGAQPAGVLLEDGRLFIPTVDGIAVFDTQADQVHALPPSVLIERVLLDGEPIEYRSGMSLPAGARNLEIHYTALSFRAPDRISFRYRLAGFDDRWVEAGPRRVAYFPVIPSGRLRFQVIASNHDGAWNEIGDGFELDVRPALTQRPSLYLALLVAALFAGFFLVRLRSRWAQRRERDLLAEVDQRTAELAKLAELTEYINRAVKLHQVLDHTYETLNEFVPYEHMILGLVDSERLAIRMIWSRRGKQRGVQGREFVGGFRSPGLTEVLQSGQPRIIDDLADYLAAHPDSQTTRRLMEEGIKSSMICPLRVGDQAEGFLVLASGQARAYRDAHVDFLKQLASQLALAVSKSRLYDELLEAKRELEERNDRLAALARRDELTGIANRRAFEQSLDADWSAAVRTRALLSLLMIDVDHFKAFNDALGHQAGDECLRRIANALCEVVEAEASAVARVGGEEFAVVLPGSDAARALELGWQLCERVAELSIRHPAAGELDHVTISVGAATLEVSMDCSRGELMRLADQALYAAKAGGRNRAVRAG